MQTALAPTADWPEPVEIVNAGSNSPLVLVCDHASNHIPAVYGRLGVAPSELRRHIAWDIGAAEVTRALAARLGAPAFLGAYSRLLVDLNRPFGVPTSMPVISEATRIPRNEGLDEAERTLRRERMFEPFHEAIAKFLDRRGAAKNLIVAMHSFTPVFLGVARPWHIGVLHEDGGELAQKFLAALRTDPALVVGDNEPYRIDREGDYAIPVHGTDRGNPAVLIEIRHDLIDTPEGIATWAGRLAAILEPIVATCQPAA
ncbi:N-formylglutamate amidohydrolase [Mesorhizobium yinganensis]|uniref:N-formylglutamate amidohydrolase n=1 Tax=Mesorhizobium yinganensis TaxID=3157707 RepID=UPI0032B7E8FE